MHITFYQQGTVYHEHAPKCQTENQHFYLKVRRQLLNAVHHKWPRNWQSGARCIHRNNSPVHSAQVVQQFLAEHHIPQMCTPLPSPEITPLDFLILPWIKNNLKEKQFEDVAMIKRNTTHQLLELPRKK